MAVGVLGAFSLVISGASLALVRNGRAMAAVARAARE
jgi:hypothetical protein